MASPPALRAMLWLSLALLVPGLTLPSSRPRPAPAAPRRPPRLHLQWVRDLPAPRPAWPDQPRLQFDAAYRPVVHGHTLLVGSSRDDAVLAYDADTGAEKWRFTTDGPVRFAPAVWEDRAYFVSDDGHLYCVGLGDGALRWRFRGGPSGRKVLGNGRLVSTWPARGAPVVAPMPGGRTAVYFAAGIWPFMGIFLHALDARTGAVLWTNDGDGSIYIKQPHQADSFAGVAPQGALVVAGDRLLVPGRSTPACYDRRTGRLLHFRLADNSKRGGGPDVTANGSVYHNGGALFDLATGTHLGRAGEPALLAGNTLYAVRGGEVRAFDAGPAATGSLPALDRKGRQKRSALSLPVRRGGADVNGRVEVLAHDDTRLFGGAGGRVFALDLPLRDGPVSWEAAVEGHPVYLLSADGRLFVSTREGRLYCFGPTPGEPRHYSLPVAVPAPADAWTARAAEILTKTGVREGYCVAWGAGSGRLIAELARQSRLHVVAVEPDVKKARAVRERLRAEGLDAERVAILQGTPAASALPPYLASLMVSEDLDGAGFTPNTTSLRALFEVLRPYGGTACLPGLARRDVEAWARAAGLAGAKVRPSGRDVLLARVGPLPGAGDWTHEHGDAANTRVSADTRVMAPLGLLWFGGPGHAGVLPRHGHGPQPQVLDGRIIQEGVDGLRALDVYTGRLLWEARLPGLGRAYDTLPHQPGANAGGGNYVSTAEGVYVAHGRACVRLDPASGRRTGSFTLPPFPGAHDPPAWSFVTAAGRYLVGGANSDVQDRRKRHKARSSSKRLVVLDRKSGRVLWEATARHGFRHNAVCLGGGRLYAIDRPSADDAARLRRRGEESSVPPRLTAFDLETGREAWSTEEDVFGTWLSYAAKHDVLIEAGRVARDTLADEPKGMRAYRGVTGKTLWHRRDYLGPAMIHGHRVIHGRGACDLLTGAPVTHADPLTGAAVEWTWTRNYGCNTPMASAHLLTFRSGAAGYCDLRGDGGTGNLGGFRSGCTNNLIVAGGVLSAPDYTRNCTCSYQNQCSLALVPSPEAEMWTFTGKRRVEGVVRRAGLNLGAPGGRQADDGTLWLEHPPVGGPSPRLTVTLTPSNPSWFRRHSASVGGDGLPWVVASGARGLTRLRLILSPRSGKPRPYTVRLFFLEPDGLPAGKRCFDVALQGRTVLRGLDVSREAGGPGRGLVRECRGVAVGRELTVTLTPSGAAAVRESVLCGVEVVAEGW